MMDTTIDKGPESSAGIESPQRAQNPRKKNFSKVGTPNGHTIKKELKSSTETQSSDTVTRKRLQETCDKEKKMQIPRTRSMKTSLRRNSTGSLNIVRIDLTWNENGSKRNRSNEDIVNKAMSKRRILSERDNRSGCHEKARQLYNERDLRILAGDHQMLGGD